MSVECFKELAASFVNDEFADFTVTYDIESKTETPDGQGGFTSSWSTFASVTGFAAIDASDEGMLDDHIKSMYSRKFSFEYIAGIKNDMRILYSGVYYNIRSIDSIQDSTIWINIMADMDVAL
jgi:head-tail adaptor